jgi:hypothetical protein
MVDPLNKPVGVLRRPYGNVRRVFYGGLWSLYTIALAFAFFHFLSVGQAGTAFVAAGIAALTGNYAYRIWTWRARHFWILIIF